jgi:hypothetical protein
MLSEVAAIDSTPDGGGMSAPEVAPGAVMGVAGSGVLWEAVPEAGAAL